MLLSMAALLHVLGLGLNRVYVKTTADRVKINHARTERPCDPDDAITWQSSAE